MAHYARMSLINWHSVTCRDCHKNTRPPGTSAKAAHAKMETEGATYINCHQNLVHKKVPEMDLNANKAQGVMRTDPTLFISHEPLNHHAPQRHGALRKVEGSATCASLFFQSQTTAGPSKGLG